METDFWVFAYGSLMWNPGFEPEAVLPARVFGYHRRFCLYSTHYRGTPERPGLVLGLDRGGSCTGLLFKVRCDQTEAVRESLWQREMFAGAYDAKTIPVMPFMANPPDACGQGLAQGLAQGLPPISLTQGGTPIPALAFVINRSHPRYAGKLCLDTQASLIALAQGNRGPNLEYLSETVASLQKLGCCPQDLVTILQKAHRCCGGDLAATGGDEAGKVDLMQESPFREG